jgi:DNA-binding transcriptional LysR family regulator
MGLSQSGVSHTINSLENELDAVLILRNRNGISLTELGTRIAEHARRIQNSQEQILQEIADAKGLKTGSVRIGCFPSIASKWLPYVLGSFRKSYPYIQIILMEGTYGEIQKWILEGSIHIGFATNPTNQLETIELTEDELVVVLPQEHPLTKHTLLSIDQIQQEPFIMPIAGCEELISLAFRKARAIPQTQFEIKETFTILNMIPEGLGITILPELSLPRSMPNLEVRKLSPRLKRNIYLACRSFDSATPAVKEFVSFFREWMANNDSKIL